jgi:GMP synthase-like glutamine amidotransferase
MIKTKIVYLEYIDEFESYGISKQTIAELKKQNIVADIRLPKGFNAYTSSTAPTLGFLLGQDKSSITKEEFYTISEPYLETTLKTGAKIKFLDFENTYEQCKNCHGIILPGGAFDNPDNFFIDNKNLPSNENKRYFAYHCAIMNAHKNKKPMLGICAGAQMIGAILGNMKMYRCLETDIPKHAIHKPKLETDVRVHQISLIKNTEEFSCLTSLPKHTLKNTTLPTAFNCLTSPAQPSSWQHKLWA